LKHNVKLLNSWYPGYLVNNEAFEKLLERISLYGWNTVSQRLKFVWKSIQELMFLRKFPDLFIMLGTSKMNSIAVREAFELAIPVIGIISPDTTTSKLYISLRWPATQRLVDLYYRIFYEAIYVGLFKIFTDELLMLTGVKESVSLYIKNIRGNELKEYRFSSIVNHYAEFEQVTKMTDAGQVFLHELARIPLRYRHGWSFFLRNMLFSLECTVIRWLKQKKTININHISREQGLVHYKTALLKAYSLYQDFKLFFSIRQTIKTKIRPFINTARTTLKTWRKYVKINQKKEVDMVKLGFDQIFEELN